MSVAHVDRGGEFIEWADLLRAGHFPQLVLGRGPQLGSGLAKPLQRTHLVDRGPLDAHGVVGVVLDVEGLLLDVLRQGVVVAGGRVQLVVDPGREAAHAPHSLDIARARAEGDAVERNPLGRWPVWQHRRRARPLSHAALKLTRLRAAGWNRCNHYENTRDGMCASFNEYCFKTISYVV